MENKHGRPEEGWNSMFASGIAAGLHPGFPLRIARGMRDAFGGGQMMGPLAPPLFSGGTM